MLAHLHDVQDLTSLTRADGESNALLVDVGGILLVDPGCTCQPAATYPFPPSHSHVVSKSDLTLLVANDWEAKVAARDLVDVLDPAAMALDGVGAEADKLDATLGELWLELRKGTKLGCADGSVVLWVGEQNNPVVADELVEVDGAGGGLGVEVGGNAAEAERGGRHGECVRTVVEVDVATRVDVVVGRKKSCRCCLLGLNSRTSTPSPGGVLFAPLGFVC